MSEAVKNTILIRIVIAGFVLMSSTSMPFVYAQPTQTSLTITVPYNPPARALL
ncbi:MAG: hypothetical protein JSV20_07610 [Candidatus Bathyarchaeota archaeon]|nr:MAG: hypothetical protein JSV20_07610 [Candidatus Bathyarchaeota archaeon]